MIRADYCGDGVTWTTNGRLIDLWDYYEIQTDTNPGWTFEAAWTTDGAICVHQQRHNTIDTPWWVLG